MSHEFSEKPLELARDQARDANPYASPLATGPLLKDPHADRAIGVWSAGVVLVMHPQAHLPERCVCTNALCDASERRIYVVDSQRTLSAWRAILGLCGAIFAAYFLTSQIPERLYLAAGAVALPLLLIWLFVGPRPAEVIIAYSLSRSTARRRWILRGVAVALFVLGSLATPLAISSNFSDQITVSLVIGGVLLCGVSWFCWLASRLPLQIKRGAPPYLEIAGCGPEFRQQFPLKPGLYAGTYRQLRSKSF